MLGAFAKFRNATISFVTSLCLSACPSVRPTDRLFVRTEQLGSHWKDFYENLYLSIF